MRLLLLSNSTNHGSGYLDHAAGEISDHFAGVKRILFVPFAVHDQEGYWAIARNRFADLGIEVDRLRGAPAPLPRSSGPMGSSSAEATRSGC
jgi:dipeptidase E